MTCSHSIAFPPEKLTAFGGGKRCGGRDLPTVPRPSCGQSSELILHTHSRILLLWLQAQVWRRLSPWWPRAPQQAGAGRALLQESGCLEAETGLPALLPLGHITEDAIFPPVLLENPVPPCTGTLGDKTWHPGPQADASSQLATHTPFWSLGPGCFPGWAFVGLSLTLAGRCPTLPCGEEGTTPRVQAQLSSPGVWIMGALGDPRHSKEGHPGAPPDPRHQHTPYWPWEATPSAMAGATPAGFWLRAHLGFGGPDLPCSPQT